jgi:hypothetical protein
LAVAHSLGQILPQIKKGVLMQQPDFTDENLDILRKVFDPGSPGQFPDDKISVNDQGKARFTVSALNGRVVLAFDKPVSTAGFSVKAARNLSQLLAQRANEAAALARKK